MMVATSLRVRLIVRHGDEQEVTMQFGAYLPTYWDDYRDSSMPVAIMETAQAAEALGYDAVWANDQVIGISPGAEGGGWQDLEPLVTLASLIHLVPRIRLGTSVLVLPQRNPILVAKQAAALDLLSGHRLILGVGIGHRAEEFALLGADFASRAAVTNEAIEVMQTLWREPNASYQGQFVHLDGVSMPPHPPDGGPPIWIGGDTLASVRRAARYGDGWLPFNWDLDAFRAGVSLLQELTQGRRNPMIANVFYFRIERSDEPATVRTTTPWMPKSFAGSPDAVARHLESYRQAGLGYALCGFEAEDLDDLIRQLHVFAEQVAPRFSDAG
jgi:probable F420-dependent oxidoreductase